MDYRNTLRVILSGHRWVVGRFPPSPYEIETDLSRGRRLRLLFQLKNGPFRPPLTQARELGVTSLTVSPFVTAACLIGSNKNPCSGPSGLARRSSLLFDE